MIIAHRQEYFVAYKDIQITAGIDTYSLPSESISLGLRKACYVENNGLLENLAQISVDKVADNRFFMHDAFYFMGNDIVFYPKPRQSRTVRLYYHRDPNEVISVSDSRQITAIDTGTNVLTFATVPSEWEAGLFLDVIKKSPGFDLLGDGLEILAKTSSTVTLADVSGLSVGDWVALQGFSPIAQIPKNAFKIVEQAAAIKCLEAMGADAQLAEKKLKDYVDSFSKIIAPRSQGGSEAIAANIDGILKIGFGKRFRHRGI